MEGPRCSRQFRLAIRVVWILAGASAVGFAQSVEVKPSWMMELPALDRNQGSARSVAVPLDADGSLVTVVPAGMNPAKPGLRLGARSIPVEVIGHDPVSRLGFYDAAGPLLPQAMEWRDSADGCVGEDLRALTSGGEITCLATGWVKQVGRKILPLALLHVNFASDVPPPGTALVDRGGRVVAVVFQQAGSSPQGRSAYAIPAEAVHRVRRDVFKGGTLVRGWLGLSLLAENQSPQVVRVIQGSPAAAAGIQPGDVLASVGSRRIANYADAADAFFYLVPGQPVSVKLLRGVRQVELDLTPVKAQAE